MDNLSSYTKVTIDYTSICQDLQEGIILFVEKLLLTGVGAGILVQKVKMVDAMWCCDIIKEKGDSPWRNALIK